MNTRADQDTEKERNRARIAADLAEFLRRGGEIKQVATGDSLEASRRNTQHYSPANAGGSGEA